MNLKQKLKIFVICFILGFVAFCGHETKSAIEKLQKDTSIDDATAIKKMAEASWIYKVTDKSRDYKATKNSSGKFLLTAATFDEFTGTYSKTVAKFVSNNMFDDAKYILRLIQGAEKRGLEEIRYSHFIMVAGSKLELYRVYISIPMLDSKIPGWREALVYDVGDHDILDNEVAKKVVEEVMNNWKIEVNNSSQIKL